MRLPLWLRRRRVRTVAPAPVPELRRPRPSFWWIFPAALLIGSVIAVMAWWLLSGIPNDLDPYQLVTSRRGAVQTALGAGAGIGAAFTLMLAFRRQHHAETVNLVTAHDATECRVTELYTKAAEQLGSDKAAVRLAGLYALERLAQDNPGHRQTIVNVICAYLRMPYAPPEASLPASPSPGPWQRTGTASPGRGDEEERQVRLTAQRILADHLRDDRTPRQRERGEAAGPRFWEGMRIDLTGAVLIDLDFAHCHITDARFDEAIFAGDARFTRASFGGHAWFAKAIFTGHTRFGKAIFTGHAVFEGASFTGDAMFDGVSFAGDARFDEASFGGRAGFGKAIFTGHARFGKTSLTGDARFDEASFTGGAWFGKTSFGGGAWFGKASFTGHARFGKTSPTGDARFDEASFNKGVRIDEAVFTGGAWFGEASFTGPAWFGGTVFAGSARFGEASFTGPARFGGAIFSGPIWFGGAVVAVPGTGHVWPEGWWVTVLPDGTGRLEQAGPRSAPGREDPHRLTDSGEAGESTG